MFHAPSQDSNLKTKGLTPCGFFAVKCFHRVEIWLAILDTFRTSAGSALGMGRPPPCDGLPAQPQNIVLVFADVSGII